jgi:hypothetical protein
VPIGNRARAEERTGEAEGGQLQEQIALGGTELDVLPMRRHRPALRRDELSSRKASARSARSKIPRRLTQCPRLVETVTSGEVVTICPASADPPAVPPRGLARRRRSSYLGEGGKLHFRKLAHRGMNVFVRLQSSEVWSRSALGGHANSPIARARSSAVLRRVSRRARFFFAFGPGRRQVARSQQSVGRHPQPRISRLVEGLS